MGQRTSQGTSQRTHQRTYRRSSQSTTTNTARLERKTHHESWSQESSVKERFRLDARDLRSYLAGGAAAKSQTRDRTLDRTLDVESATLAKEIAEDQLFARGLTPSVGTRYQRTAFQRADTNDVRVSLDVDLVFTDARDCSCPRDD